jgi:Iap family predicted aminopeptidase
MKVAQRTRLLLAFLHLSLALLSGCVSIPAEHLSQPIETQELSDHVHFLAQPGLKGRRPRTWESATVRRYLKERFEAYGLVPWADRKGYEQSFGFGTNVIGVLPGSDANLADQIVVVTAHYDHVGKTKKGVLLGACDNASGVAALLEIAEHLSLAEQRPRRPVCFASFDCEEQFTLGSFVFTCRKDFDESRIAAVVNVDLLGRDVLDVVPDSLFVVGTGPYPQLRALIRQAGAGNGLKVLPVGTDMIGPRGDHVAFETMDIPVLFFTCGLYEDYHKPTDTADKLNYPKTRDSAGLIAETVKALANADRIERPTKQVRGDREELQSLIHVLDTVQADAQKAGLGTEQEKELPGLIAEAQSLLADAGYTRRNRQQFAQKTIETLLPTLTAVDDARDEDVNGLLIMNELYASHRKVLIEGFRDVVRHILENRPGLFGKVKFEQKV